MLFTALMLLGVGAGVAAPPSDELCMEGTLLFREDFGGNDVNDPVAGTNPVIGMTSAYTQIYDTASCMGGWSPCVGMGSGRYLLTKTGYRNSTAGYNYSHWFKMDDHTYPNDYTRGYLLEIDGSVDNATLYEAVIDGLCEGSTLTFSAYVANITISFSYDQSGNTGEPELSFILQDPETGIALAPPYNTGPIPVDRSYQDEAVSLEWRHSAQWHLVGTNFEVPSGKTAVKLTIKNACTSNNGNDFALDDIEIRLCAPPVTIEGEPEVCENTATTLTADFTNDGTFAEPLAYKWWHSMDSLTWTELSETTNTLTMSAIQKADSGWYRVAVSGESNIESVNCRAMSEPFLLNVKDCEPLAEPLCMEGTLLFREDFGGNDPEDPRLVDTPTDIPGMTYDQLYTDALGSMRSGGFLITKEGYCNGDTSVTNPYRGSQWHLQDDHTYPDDKTRGYFLEIDGRGDHAAFYTRTINMLCEGSKLTFSAYVANVVKWNEYTGRPGYFAYPRLLFVLTDPDGNELKSYDTGEIPFDSTYMNDYSSWQYSSKWHLVGMNFEVPEGVSSVTLTIYNNVDSPLGNDFALDDIEVRLCAPPVTIEGEPEVCENTATTLTADFTNDGTFAEPLAYKWWHSMDSLTWTELSETTNALSVSAVQKTDSGWYRVAVSGEGNIESLNCRAMSEPFLLNVKECEPPEPPMEELCTDGLLLFREDFGGNDPGDTRVRETPVLGMSYDHVTSDVFHSMGSGKYIVTKSGYCNGDTTGWSLPGADQSTYRSQWYIQDDHTYPNDYSRGYFMEIDGSGGNQQFYQTEISGLCEGIELTFSAYVANVFTWFQYDWYTRNRGPVIAPCLKFVLTNPQTGETLAEKNTKEIPFDENLPAKTDWQYSSAWHLVGMNFTVPIGVNAIRLSIYNNVTNGNGNDFALDDIEIRLCMTPVTVRTDTTVCDTLPQITWRKKSFALADTLRDTLRSSCGFDSVYYMLHVEIEHCEPPVPPTPPDPPTPPEPECYPIIVNKYNWVLLVDNVKVRELLPNRTVLKYQWYKNGEPIPGANEDDYSEFDELHGTFQMILTLDGDEEVCSNILEINTTVQEEQPVHVFIYDSRGVPVRENQVTHGIYLYRYEQGDQVWTEKKFIP